jgi:hypothetical protein
LSGFQEVNEKTSANQFEFCRCRSVIGERNPTQGLALVKGIRCKALHL